MAAPGRSEPVGARAESGGQDGAVPNEAPSRILIVATDDAMFATHGSVVSAGGYVPVTARWPVTLPRLIEEHTPDLLILCVGADEVWGYEACADLRLVDPAHE